MLELSFNVSGRKKWDVVGRKRAGWAGEGIGGKKALTRDRMWLKITPVFSHHYRLHLDRCHGAR